MSRSPAWTTDYESVENSGFAWLFGNSVCQLCARFWRHNCAGHPYATFYDRLSCGWCGRKAAFRYVVVLQNMRDPESRQHLPARRGICPHVPPQIFIPAAATKACEIVAVRPSLGLENANPSSAALKHCIAGTDNSPCLRHYRKTILALFIRDATPSEKVPGSGCGRHSGPSILVGRVKAKRAPRGELSAAHRRPPCDSTIERLIRSPMPVP